MAAKPFITAPEDYAPALDIVGEHVTVLASGEATGGYEIFLQRGAEGSGPPPHSHPWDESFYVVRGQIDFGGGEMVSITSRLGASRMFTDFAREVAPVNPDLEQLAEVGARHGLKVEV